VKDRNNAQSSLHALRESVAYPENKTNHSGHNQSCGVVAEPGKIHGYLHPKVITDCIYNHTRELELPQQTQTTHVAHNKVLYSNLDGPGKYQLNPPPPPPQLVATKK